MTETDAKDLFHLCRRFPCFLCVCCYILLLFCAVLICMRPSCVILSLFLCFKCISFFLHFHSSIFPLNAFIAFVVTWRLVAYVRILYNHFPLYSLSYLRAFLPAHVNPLWHCICNWEGVYFIIKCTYKFLNK